MIVFSHQYNVYPVAIKAEKSFGSTHAQIHSKANSMEDLLDIIEKEIKKRGDYLHHLRFGNRIIFESKNSQVHWISIDSYSAKEYRDLEQSYTDRFT